MKTINTWLPVFPGFYSTIFEPDEECEIYHINDLRTENDLPPLPFEAIKFDYEGYQNDVAESCCNIIERELSDFITSLKFQSVSSPREYNFRNDSVNIAVELSEDNEKTIKKYLLDNNEDFRKYIKNRYTSCDGFMSFYSNDSNDWFLDADLLEHDHKLGSVLEFICEMLGINDETLYYNMEAYLSAINYDECITKPYCAVCNEFFAGPNKNICPDCIEAGRANADYIFCCKCHEEIQNKQEKRHFALAVKLHEVDYDKIVCNDCSL